MDLQSQNKIYYLGSPHSANYIPSSALKNRKKKNYLVEIPQGDDYFGSSRKKQYAGLHNQSQIKSTGLFQQYSSNYSHGTYEVADIEGAVPDSLMSQAVKNRMKGYFRAQEESRRGPRHIEMEHNVENMEENQYLTQQKQLEGRNNEKNYHFSRIRHIQTEPAEPTPMIQPITFKTNQRRNIPEWTQTESPKIKELQQQLFQNQQTRLKLKKNINGHHHGSQNTVAQSQKKIAPLNDQVMQALKDDRFSSLKRSKQEIKEMWHGDHHKITLFPQKDIRRLNPTYLSSEAYVNTRTPVYYQYH